MKAISSLTFLALLCLTTSEPLTVFCQSDGLCQTENGGSAVCASTTPENNDPLPLAEDDGVDYRIHIDANIPLDDGFCAANQSACSPIPLFTEPEPNPDVCDLPIPGMEEEVPPPFLFATVNNPNNPILGGVGCETPAFVRRCQLCCFETALRRRSSSRRSFSSNNNVPRGALEASMQNCFTRRPLGFFRTPTPRFFPRCNGFGICRSGVGCRRS